MSGATTAERITVAELARQLGLGRELASRLLAQGRIPGAFRLDPSKPRGHYFIPPDAAERFRAGEGR